MDIPPLLSTLIGTAIGGLISALSSYVLWRRGRSDGLNELKRTAYAEWAAVVHDQIYGVSGGPSFHEAKVCENRLLLLESDKGNRELIRVIQDSEPAPGTEEAMHFEGEMNSYDPKWSKFEDPMAKLMERVRVQLTKRL